LSDSEWPTFSEELSRKAMEKLNDAVHRRGENLLNDGEVFLIADTLLDLVMGLVPFDVTDTIDSVRKAVKQ
jgi:hypothetical protein